MKLSRYFRSLIAGFALYLSLGALSTNAFGFTVYLDPTDTYTVTNFSAGSMVVFRAGTSVSVNNVSFTDGVVDVIGTLNGQIATAHFTGIALASDSAISNIASFNTVFGAGAITVASCTLTASPVSISAGESSTLTASCTPSPTSYSWTGGTCVGDTVATCTVNPTASTTYSVTGSNMAGVIDTATATVTTLTCISPRVLQNGGCVTPTPTCIPPQILQNGACVTPTPTCTYPQVLQNGVCATPTPTVYTQTIGAISFSPTTLTVGGTGTVSATATSGLAVFFSSTTPSICTVIGSTVTSVSAGICTIVANQSGNASYSAVSQTASINIGNPAATFYMLTVTNTGNGSGTVTSSDGSINCGSTCSVSYTSGASVTLTATPASGSTFTGWGGACTGTGACTVSINAAKNVTATFNPFTIATTGVTAAGIITAPVATVTATISVNAADVGQTRSVFITAMMPQSAIGTTLAMTASNASRTLALAAPASSLVLMNLTSTNGWQPVVNGVLIPYTTGVLSAQTFAITILNNANTASLTGSQFCVGYGTSVTEMNSAGRMQLIASVPDPNAASAATASCLLISDARVFAYAEANYSSIFAGTATAGQATYQGNQYDYRYYPGSQNYLAVDPSGMVFVLGPYTSSALTPVGQVESFRSVITAWEAAP